MSQGVLGIGIRLAENRLANVGLLRDDTYFCPCSTSNKLNGLPSGKWSLISHETPPKDLAFQGGFLEMDVTWE